MPFLLGIFLANNRTSLGQPGVVPANQTEESEVQELPGRSLDLVRNPSFKGGFSVRNGKANKFTQIFFRVCFRNDHVGHAQATIGRPRLRNKLKSRRFSFAFAFVIKEREKIPTPGIFIYFRL